MNPKIPQSGNPSRPGRLAAGIVPAVALALLSGCGPQNASSTAEPAESGEAGISGRTVAVAEPLSAPLSLSAGAPVDQASRKSSRADAPYASPFVPPPYSGIYPEEIEALLTGEFVFEPDPIPDEGVPVGDSPLTPGEVLQVRSGGVWWAGIVLEIEAAGEVLIGYFGWDESHDERKDRIDLKFNPDAARAAVNTKYWPLVF